MTYKYMCIEDQHLAYQEKNEDAGPIIFFIHGNSASSNAWKYQLADERFNCFRLIAFDLPGHGLTEEPLHPNTMYALPELGRLLAEAVKLLSDASPYILVGVSLGTNIIGEMIAHNLQPAGVALLSPTIVSSVEDLQDIFTDNPHSAAFFGDKVDEEQAMLLSNECFYNKDKTTLSLFKNDFLNTAPEFRTTLMKTTSEGIISDEIYNIKRLGKPVLIAFGTEDKIARSNYLDQMDFPFWRNQIFKWSEAGHFLQFDVPVLCSKLLAEFAKEVILTGRVS